MPSLTARRGGVYGTNIRRRVTGTMLVIDTGLRAW
jgi:hypothetical protein